MKIQVFGPCSAYTKDNEELTAEKTLLSTLHGHVFRNDDEDDCFGFWLIDEPDESPIKNVGISRGYLSFTFNEPSGELIASVEYQLERALTELEIEKLVEYTSGQCSDGIGDNFMQMGCDQFPVAIASMTGSIQHKRIGF